MPISYDDYKKKYEKQIAENKKKRREEQTVSFKETKKPKKKKDTWFDTGAFDDGYDFGDITKTILGTGTNVAQSFTKGVLGIGETALDLGTYGVSGVLDLFGADKQAEAVKKFGQKNLVEEYDLVNKAITNSNPLLSVFDTGKKVYDTIAERDLSNLFDPRSSLSETMNDYGENNSLLGTKSDQIVEGVGYVGGMTALSLVGVNPLVTAFTTSMGNEMTNAFNNDATYGEAFTSGLISGISEAGSEALFGGLGKINGKGALDDQIAKGVAKIFKKQWSRNLAEFGVKSLGEGGEEVISNIGSSIGRLLYDDSDNNLINREFLSKFEDGYDFGDVTKGTFNTIFNEENLEQAINGIIVSAISQSPGLVRSTRSGRSYTTGLSQNEQKVIDNVANKRIADMESKGETLTERDKAKITKEVEEDLKEGQIDTKDIENSLGQEEVAKWNGLNERANTLRQQLSATTDVKEQNNISREIKKVEAELGKNSLLQRSYYEKAQQDVRFKDDTTKTYSKNESLLREDARKILNNTTQAHKTVEVLSNMSNESGIQYRLTNNNQPEMKAQKQKLIKRYAEDNNLDIKEAEKRFANTEIDGFVGTNGETYINASSPKAINYVVAHETTHHLEKLNSYKEYNALAVEYAKSKGDYDTLKSQIYSMYKGTNANVDNEITAEITAKYLSDVDFLTNLAQKDRNVFQKMYDYVKHLVKKATAGSQEKRQLEEMEYKFKKVYRELTKQNKNKSVTEQNEQTTTQETKDNSHREAERNTEKDEKYSFGNKGYVGQSMSVRAKSAYSQGLKPISQWDTYDLQEINEILDEQGIEKIKSVAELKGLLELYGTTGEWHHTGSFYNETTFYDANLLLEEDNLSKKILDYREQRKEEPRIAKEKAQNPNTYKGNITYLTWEGTRKHPRPVEHYLKDVNIEERGSFYIITNDNGQEILRKKIGSNGTMVTKSISNNDTKYSLSDMKSADNIVNDMVINDFSKTGKVSQETNELQSRLIDFQKKHKSDFDNTYNHNVNSDYYIVDDNLVKLTTTLENDTLYIDELYVENQRQGIGTKVVNALKEYAKQNGYSLTTNKEVTYAKGFWDKVLRDNTKYSLSTTDKTLIDDIKPQIGTLKNGDKAYKWQFDKTKPYNIMVTETKDGIIFNNAYLSDEVKGKGEGTKIALKLNEMSLENTGYPLKSLPEYNKVGLKNHTDEGKALWESLVRKGYAVKSSDNSYSMLETAPTVQEYTEDDDIRYSLSEKTSNYEDIKYQQLSDVLESDKVKQISNELGIGYTMLDANISGRTIYGAVEFIKSQKPKIVEDFVENNKIKYEKVYDKNGELEEYRTYQNVKKVAEENGINDYIFNKLKPLLDKEMLSTDDLTEKAQETYGITDDFSIGAYMTPDGKLLDFDPYKSGYREDHRDISSIGYSMQEFIDAGNIRMKPEANGFEMSQEPTRQQYDTLRTYIDDYISNSRYEYIIAEIDKGNNQYDSAEYKVGTPSSKIINDIKEYYRTGSFPKQSDLAQFRYSLSRTNNDIAPTKGNIYGKDIEYQKQVQQQVEEAVAPLQETITNLSNQITDLQEMFAPTVQEVKEQMASENLDSYMEANVPESEGTFTFNDEPINVKYKSEIVREIQNDFAIKHKEARELYNKIDSIVEPTIDDVYEILDEYRDIKLKETNELKREVKRVIRGTKIDVSDLKVQVTDYNDFRKSNFGKLRLANNGQPIDAVYEELTNMYPSEFDSNLTNPADQLEYLADYMNSDVEITEEYTIDDNTLYDLAKRIYTDIGNRGRLNDTSKAYYFLTKDLKNMLPPSLDVDGAYKEWLAEKGVANTPQAIETWIKTLPEDYKPFIEMYRKVNASNTSNTNKSVPKIERNGVDVINELIDRQANGNRNTDTTRVDKPKSSLEKTWGSFQQNFVNDMYYVDKMAKDFKNEKIKHYGYMLKGVSGEAQSDIFNKQIDNYGKEKGESVEAIWRPAHEQGLFTPFEDYLKQKLNIERWKTNKPLWKDVYPEQSEALVKAYEETYPQFVGWGKKAYKFYENAMDNKIDGDLISRKDAKHMRDLYPSYMRIEVDKLAKPYVDMTPDEIRTKAPFKRAVGGSGDMAISLEQAMANSVYQDRLAIRQNKLYLEIAKTLRNKRIELGADTRKNSSDMSETLYLDEDTGKYYLTAYENGERFTVEINEDLYKGLNNDLKQKIKELEEDMSLITRPLQTLGNLKRDLVTTYSPSFMFNNPPKDFFDGIFFSKHPVKFLKNYVPSLLEVISNRGDAKTFRNLYGSAMSMGDYAVDSGLGNTDGKLTTRLKNTWLLRGIRRLNEITELTPRVAEFKSSLESGATIEEAMYDGRDITVNFDRGGTITKAIDRNGAKFLNVSTQGFDKFVRNFSGQNGARAWTGAMLQAIMVGVVPALFNHLMFGWDDEEDEDYKALPDYIKDNYFLFKTDDGEFIRIPKGRAMSVFGSAGRRVLEYLDGEEDAFEGFLKNANTQVGVMNPFKNNLFSPLIQAINNETWYGEDLIPKRLQDKPAKEQYDESIDKLSIWLGEQTGISPYKINYVIDQYSGGIGDFLLPLGTEEAKSSGSFLAPLADKFTADSTTDNKYVSDIYSLADELKMRANSSNATDEDLLKQEFIKHYTSEMGKLYQERREVQNDDSLSKKEKYAKSQAIKDQINALAKEGLESYENISKTSNYSSVGDQEYYKGSNGNWYSPRESELDNMNSMGMSLEEKGAYYSAKNNISSYIREYEERMDNATEDERNDLYAEKKSYIAQYIKNTNLTSDQKLYLYDRYYGNTNKIKTLQLAGVSADTYLDFESQSFYADKDAYGKTISGSKQKKIVNYLNTMNADYGSKIILFKSVYPSNDMYNKDIVEYLNNNDDITYDEEVIILESLGFKVDENGYIYWD